MDAIKHCLRSLAVPTEAAFAQSVTVVYLNT